MKYIEWILNGLLSMFVFLLIILSNLWFPVFVGNELVFIGLLVWILLNQRNVWEED